MPHISVKLYPGRSQEMKENLAHKLQECLASESGCWSNDDISVSFEEIGPEGFEETVKNAILDGIIDNDFGEADRLMRQSASEMGLVPVRKDR